MKLKTRGSALESILTELFNYPDGPLPTNVWTYPAGAINVVSGVARIISPGRSAITALIADPQYLALTDYAVECVYTAPDRPGENVEIRLWFRWMSNRDNYFIAAMNNYLRFVQFIDGVYHTQTFITGVLAGGTHKLRVECEGSNIRAFLDDVLIINVTDTAHTVGKFGFGEFNIDCDFDYILVESLAPPLPTYQLTLASDKPAYQIDETILLSGVLTVDGSPVVGAPVVLYKNGVTHLETTTLGDGSYGFADPAALEAFLEYYTEHVIGELLFRSPPMTVRRR